jgi:rhodanese-related sulfurtransferase
MGGEHHLEPKGSTRRRPVTRFTELVTNAGALVSAVLMVMALAAPAAAVDTPTSIQGAKTVGADEVKSLQAQGAKVFDLRKKAAYVEKHVPGSLHVKYDEKSAKVAAFDASVDAFDLGQLPPDKHAKVVLHGHGADGWKAYKASVLAVKAGYTNVHFFRGGFAEWVTKGFPTE